MNNFNFSQINLNNLALFSGLNIMFKIGFLIADLFAVIFLLVVLKQVSSMDHIVHDSNDFFIIRFSAFLLLITAVSLFLAALVIL